MSKIEKLTLDNKEYQVSSLPPQIQDLISLYESLVLMENNTYEQLFKIKSTKDGLFERISKYVHLYEHSTDE